MRTMWKTKRAHTSCGTGKLCASVLLIVSMVTAASIASSIHRMPRLASANPDRDGTPVAIQVRPVRHQKTRALK